MVEITPEESARSAYTASASVTAADGGISAGRRGSRSTRKAASSQVVLCKTFLFPFCARSRPRPGALQSCAINSALVAGQPATENSIQLCILGLGGHENRHVRIRIFPCRTEILIGRSGFGSIALQCIGSRNAKMGQRILQGEAGRALLIENALKFGSRL